MKLPSRILTLDANVLIAALKADEPQSEKCVEILTKIPNHFQLAEPSIIYQEVCGTLARKTSLDIANDAKKQMDLMINPKLLILLS
jgi:predicted nucleic acid-binding protein